MEPGALGGHLRAVPLPRPTEKSAVRLAEPRLPPQGHRDGKRDDSVTVRKRGDLNKPGGQRRPRAGLTQNQRGLCHPQGARPRRLLLRVHEHAGRALSAPRT